MAWAGPFSESSITAISPHPGRVRTCRAHGSASFMTPRLIYKMACVLNREVENLAFWHRTSAANGLSRNVEIIESSRKFWERSLLLLRTPTNQALKPTAIDSIYSISGGSCPALCLIRRASGVINQTLGTWLQHAISLSIGLTWSCFETRGKYLHTA